MSAGSSSSSTGGGSSSKQKPVDKDTFGHVVSLGSICLTARTLEIQGLRAYKAPFDWSYSSARMVRHCVQDGFKSYLDQGMLTVDKKARGTGHRLYGQMQLGNISVVWPHHNLKGKKAEDHASFARAVNRFKFALSDRTQRKLFVLCQNVRSESALEKVREAGPAKLADEGKVKVPAENGPELGSVQEVRRLFREFGAHAAGSFNVDVVYVICPPLSKAKAQPIVRKVHCEKKGAGALTVYELQCLGPNTGLFFKDERDRKALARVLTNGRKFKPANADVAKAVGLTDELHGRFQSRKAAEARKAAAKTKTARRSLGAKARKLLKRKRGVASEAAQDMKRKLRFQQENPKKSGSNAAARYEKYKKAKTVGEFFKLGGCLGDLNYDGDKGFLKLF